MTQRREGNRISPSRKHAAKKSYAMIGLFLLFLVSVVMLAGWGAV